MSNLNNLFAPQIKLDSSLNEVTEFKPNYKKGKAGIYYANVRFIPNPQDPENKSVIHKYQAFIKNPLTNQGMTVDCPSSVNEPDPIVDTFFALKNSSNAIQQQLASNFSRKSTYAALVQVLRCDSEPEIEGKILVWRFGQKVYQKIYNEMNPRVGTPINPFDIINGRIFEVTVVESSGFNNYDQCQFISANGVTPSMRMMITNPNTGQTTMTTLTQEFISNPKGQEYVAEYLRKNCPDMSQYEYHEWTPEVAEFVNKMIQMYTSGSFSAVGSQPESNRVITNTPSQVSLDSIIPGINDSQSQQANKPIQPQQVSQPSQSQTLKDLGLDGLDELLKDSTSQPSNKGSELNGNLSIGNQELSALLGSTFTDNDLPF